MLTLKSSMTLSALCLSMLTLSHQAVAQPTQDPMQHLTQNFTPKSAHTSSKVFSIQFSNIKPASTKVGATAAQCQSLFQTVTFPLGRFQPQNLAGHPFNFSPFNRIISLGAKKADASQHKTSPEKKGFKKVLKGTAEISLNQGQDFFTTPFMIINDAQKKSHKIFIGDQQTHYCSATFSVQPAK